MKYQIFKAVDKIDGDLSLFMFDENDNYTVVWYDDENVARLIKAANNHGCDWSKSELETPRRDDMVDPVLLCEFEV